MSKRVIDNSPLSSRAPVAPSRYSAEKFPCRFTARALYTSKGMRRINEFDVEVTEISAFELKIRSKFCTLLPDNFMLVLGARQYAMGCAVYYRNNDVAGCKLIKPESRAMVAFLSGVSNTRQTMHEILNPLFPRSRMQTYS